MFDIGVFPVFRFRIAGEIAVKTGAITVHRCSTSGNIRSAYGNENSTVKSPPIPKHIPSRVASSGNRKVSNREWQGKITKWFQMNEFRDTSRR